MAVDVRKRSIQAAVAATGLVLAFVVWDNVAPQPRLKLETVQIRRLPSSGQSGLVELVVRNTGSRDADIVALPVAHITPLFRSAQALVAANMENELESRLEKAAPSPPTGTTPLARGQTTTVGAAVPFSERMWYFGRGELTVLVAARIRYRDRIFNREQVFCQFANPRSSQWLPCPFLNN
jgi:hypothetical protein